MSAVPGTSKILPQYYPNTPPEGKTGIAETMQAIQAAETQMEISKSALEVAEATLKALDLPTYVGNNPLTPLSTLSDNQVTEIGQIIKDMRANNINTNLIRCFNTLSGNYDANTYLGGIYTYEVNNTIYYTTYYDLANSYVNGEGINNIDNQAKLPVYTADYVPTRKEITEKALLEVNNEGRFTTARFENDSVVYKLNAEEIEDTVGYEDAMNQYDYDKAKYDKKVAEINAQTSLIQREDQDLELRLKQLDTEQNALNTEIDAVSKVVKDNVEKSFKTFSG
jgi:prefoldin subunit 5